MERNTFNRDFILKLLWKLSCNLIFFVFSMKTPDNLQAIIFTIKSP